MIARGRELTKADVLNLLKDYDSKKGYFRTFWGDSDGIGELRGFYHIHLAVKADHERLSDLEVEELKAVLRARLGRIHDNMLRNYRAAPTKLTNAIYIQLANMIYDYTQDNKVLLLIQHYKNDYAKDGNFLYDTEGEIFVTENGYVMCLKELLDEIQATRAFFYKISEFNGESKVFVLLSPGDIDALRKHPLARNIIQAIEEPSMPNRLKR